MTTDTLSQADVAPAAPSMRSMLLPLVLDLGVPLGIYYGLHSGAHTSIVTALTASSVVPLIRTIWGFRGDGVNVLAMLILAVNIAGIALTLVSGDPRLIFAKDSGISSVVAIGILGSVVLGRPIMTAGLTPWLTRGVPARTEAMDDLLAHSPRFRRYERRFNLIWGFALLTDCVIRVIAAFTMPISTLAWLSTVLLIGAIAIASILGGVFAVNPMDELVKARVRE